MSATSTLPPSLNSHEQALAQYRSISKLSLVALALGLASALVLVNPLLAPIPLMAAAVALLSLRAIRASGGQMVGRVPAIAGLCLAMLFLGWGVSARFSRAWTLESHARRFAEAWLRLVAEGDLEQADQLRLPAHGRMGSAALRKEFYEKNPQALSEMTAFFAKPELRDFVALGENVKFRLDSFDGNERSTYVDRLFLRYTFSDAQGSTPPRALRITVKRQQDENHVDWQIESIAGDRGF
jgi:hypothetical protein